MQSLIVSPWPNFDSHQYQTHFLTLTNLWYNWYLTSFSKYVYFVNLKEMHITVYNLYNVKSNAFIIQVRIIFKNYKTGTCNQHLYTIKQNTDGFISFN